MRSPISLARVVLHPNNCTSEKDKQSNSPINHAIKSVKRQLRRVRSFTQTVVRKEVLPVVPRDKLVACAQLASPHTHQRTGSTDSATTDWNFEETDFTASTETMQEDDNQILEDAPKPAYIEPSVPDPFLVDSDEDEEPQEQPQSEPGLSALDSQQSIPVSDEIPLAASSSTVSAQTALLSPNVNKDVPPPPPSDSDIDEEDSPELYLPGLVAPTMFLPIPNTDQLSTLLAKYCSPENRPTRDISGNWHNADFHALVMSNSWRALGTMARDRIVATDPEDIGLILGLWYIRLACLARLRLFNQTSVECTGLFNVLNSIEPATSREWLFEKLLPFELEVMQARLRYWAGDHIGYLDALNALLKKSKSKARASKSDPTNVAMWKERGSRICLIIASQMVEMKEYLAATSLLEPLCVQAETASPTLRSAVGRIYIQCGHLERAASHFAVVAADPSAEQAVKDMNQALLLAAQGEWEDSGKVLSGMLATDPDNFVAANNLAVALLGQGKIKQGIETLERALRSSPSSVVVAEPFLFNLSTLYELRSSTAVEKKRDLLIEVAKFSGDGLKTTCLKMPAS